MKLLKPLKADHYLQSSAESSTETISEKVFRRMAVDHDTACRVDRIAGWVM